MVRVANKFIWLSAEDCDPPHGLDMDSPRDFNKVRDLATAFAEEGFDLDMPVLIGYPLNGRIQLLTGTHRHRAAEWTNTKLPVSLRLRSDVERLWGTGEWNELIKDTPVKELMNVVVEDGARIPPYQPVDTKHLYEVT